MSTDEQLELLRQFAPTLHFDALERWRPTPAEGYLRGSTLFDARERAIEGTPPAEPAMIAREGELEARLNPLPDGPGPNTQLRSNELLAAYGPEDDLAGAGAAYGRAIEAGGATFLQYWFFYPDNPCVLPPGRHDGDWELVQIRLERAEDGLAATQVTLAAHGKPETRPVDPGAGGVDVFVAVDSHACYFEPGAQPRAPLSDVCDPGGAGGAKPAVIPLPASPSKEDWVHWSGRWGMDRGPGTWLALLLHLKRTPSILRRLNHVGAGESPASPGHQGSSWRFPRIFAARGTQRRWTSIELRNLVRFLGRLTWPRAAPRVRVERVAAGRYAIEAKGAGAFLRRVTLVAVAFEEERPDGGRQALATYSAPTGRRTGPFEIEHDGELRWRAAGYNFLRQRGNPLGPQGRDDAQ